MLATLFPGSLFFPSLEQEKEERILFFLPLQGREEKGHWEGGLDVRGWVKRRRKEDITAEEIYSSIFIEHVLRNGLNTLCSISSSFRLRAVNQ